MTDEPPGKWLTAAQVAAYLGCERSFVYEHAADLGAHRLGTGPRGRLRFRLDLVDASPILTQIGRTPTESSPRRTPSGAFNTSGDLLPIRGRDPQRRDT